MFLHPASSLGVQAVIQRAGPQLSAGLEVPARNFQFVQQSWTQTNRRIRNAELRQTENIITLSYFSSY